MIKYFSAGGALLNSQGKVFMIHKVSRDEWSLPKGTVEEGESKLEAATREVEEETGYEEIKPLRRKPFAETSYKFDHPKTGETVEKTVYFFLFELESTESEITPEMKAEKLEGDWFKIDEATNKASFKDIKEVLKKVSLNY